MVAWVGLQNIIKHLLRVSRMVFKLEEDLRQAQQAEAAWPKEVSEHSGSPADFLAHPASVGPGGCSQELTHLCMVMRGVGVALKQRFLQWHAMP
jgi:hypothetical protein